MNRNDWIKRRRLDCLGLLGSLTLYGAMYPLAAATDRGGLSRFHVEALSGSGEVRVEYDLEGEAQDRFLVWLAVSLDAGLTYQESGWTLSGAGVDQPVGPGGGYFLLWQADQDLALRDYGEALLRLKVARVNTPPTLGPILPKKTPPGQVFTFQLEGSDPDSLEQTLTYRLENAPEGMDVDAATGRVQWIPQVGQIGVHEIRAFFSDGLEETQQSFLVEVDWMDFVLNTGPSSNPDHDMALLWIEPGTFFMGSFSGESQRDNDETRRQVTLSQGFWLGQFEVTQAQWEALMGTQPSQFESIPNLAPVDSVSWMDATGFCERLNARERAAGRLPEGYEYALPTEAQWEYACRAGTTTTYAFGNTISTTRAQYNRNQPQLVGNFAPNNWRLYDMHGNMWEWCQDWYGSYGSNPVTDPLRTTVGVNRILRGGSWDNNTSKNLRSADREGAWPSVRDDRFGFRLALRPKTESMPLIWVDYGGELSNAEAIRMIWLPAGGFKMGSPAGEFARGSDEAQLDVILREGFWLAETEVTQRQWEALMGSNPGFFKAAGTDAPIETVSWDEAVAYCEALTELERQAGRLPEGYEYALPTEAQWEYACRSGTDTVFAFGDRLSSSQSNFNGNFPYGGASAGQNLMQTTSVMAYPANQWGLFEMHGNVSEWCADWYAPLTGELQLDPVGPEDEPDEDPRKVVKGGSWFGQGADCRSAVRTGLSTGFRGSTVGFRPALRKVSVP